MAAKTVTLSDSFNNKVRIDITSLRHIAVWKDLQRVDLWGGADGARISSLQFTKDTLDTRLGKIVAKLESKGMVLLRLDGNSPDKDRDYSFYFRPETIDYFDDGIYREYRDNSDKVALVVEDIPFYLGEEEKSAFKKAVIATGQPGDWIEFSSDGTTAFNCASGHYGFRRPSVVDLFAVPRAGHMAVTTTDLRRSFVPMAAPEKAIDAIATALPQLVRSSAPAPALPLYYNPAFYPENHRHHMNIIMRS
ncbi:MAG: hypothetical protein JWO78_2494 [Micavibrio sp.]|nr:hypothetical protein [Micavibrio sp.]